MTPPSNRYCTPVASRIPAMCRAVSCSAHRQHKGVHHLARRYWGVRVCTMPKHHTVSLLQLCQCSRPSISTSCLMPRLCINRRHRISTRFLAFQQPWGEMEGQQATGNVAGINWNTTWMKSAVGTGCAKEKGRVKRSWV